MDLAHLTDEVEDVSRAYAQRHGITRDATWFLLKLHEEIGELTQAYLMRAGQARTKGFSPREIDAQFRGEVADVLCHTLLLAHHHGIDLQDAVTRKWLVWRSGPATAS